jgi:hypothetical protein
MIAAVLFAQWFLWVCLVGTGVAGLYALARLKTAEKFLPDYDRLKELNQILPVREEKSRELEIDLEEKRRQHAELDGKVGHLKLLREWEKQNPEAAEKIALMKEELLKNKSELTTAKGQLTKITNEKQKTEREVSKLKEEREGLDDIVDSLNAEEASLKDRISKLQREAASLQKETASLQKVIDGLELKIQSLEQKKNDLTDETATLKKELERVTDERNEACRVRDEAREKCEGYRAEAKVLQDQIEILKKLVQDIRVDIQDHPELSDGNYNDIFVPYFKDDWTADDDDIDETKRLKDAKEYIAGRGLFFPERVVDSFHTSLKCGEISPLVVLAGISGTGKSELPRQYADGMGLHFILSSVQPRWDSPQDLFGFYNYLEKKYKATELTRAFVQFERWNQGNIVDMFEDTEIEDRSDRMLLILLDEMNLARTEYYFSEFLSKLETRRSIVDLSDEFERMRAEIALEMGSLAGGSGIRLFPDRNILFVGTMNEDESTQTLSDKVIDRASVMRFWRPEKTFHTETPVETEKPEYALPFEAWNAWIKDPSDLGSVSSEVDGWISDLNNALEKLGRPFAFRVDRAIRTYIANYPRTNSDNWHRYAMADQIEQRIFPKLRGVETDQAQDAIHIIGNVVNELGDEALKRAFDESSDGDTVLFKGVIR